MTLSNEEVLRYSRHLIMPEVGMEGQLKLKAAKVLCIGAGGLGSPLALYLAAAGVGTLGHRRFRRGGLHQPAAADHPLDRRRRTQEAGFRRREHQGDQSLCRGSQVRDAPEQRERARYLPRFRHRRRRHRQLSHALPGERRLRADRQAERVWLDLPLRRTGQRFRHERGPVLPLPVSGAATAGAGAVVRRRRRAGHSAGAGRRHPGDGNDQADSRQGQSAHRTPAAGRRARA